MPEMLQYKVGFISAHEERGDQKIATLLLQQGSSATKRLGPFFVSLFGAIGGSGIKLSGAAVPRSRLRGNRSGPSLSPNDFFVST